MTTTGPVADRVKETSATTGTGTLTLAGAVTGFQAFSAAFTTGTTVYYCITDGTNWEVGSGVYTTSGTTLSRVAVLASSNAGALVSFAAALTVFNTVPAVGVTATAKIPVISATVAASALTVGVSAITLDFRSALISGTTNTVLSTPTALVVPSTATLGTISAQLSRLIVLEMNNGGTAELAVVNVSGGNNLDESTLVTTTAISAGATSANVVYSTSARSGLAFRVVGYIESTQATAGTWATAPSTIQGAGGQALAAMSSLGYGQTWQAVTRVSGTTYYNTTGKPIICSQSVAAAATTSISAAVNGTTVINSSGTATTFAATISFVIPPGASYVVTISAGTIQFSVELR